MKWHFKLLKQILSGFLFLLLPLTIIIIVLGKAFSIVSLILILLICYIAGVLVQNKMIRSVIQKLEDNLLVFIPGYSMLIHRAGDIVSESEDLRVVLLNEDNEWRPGIEMERQDNG